MNLWWAGVLLGAGVLLSLSPVQAETPENPPLRIVYFHSSGCEECRQVKRILPDRLAPWGPRIVLEEHDVDNLDVFGRLLQYEKHYQAEIPSPPVIFVGNRWLKGYAEIRQELSGAIGEELRSGSRTFQPPVQEATTATDEVLDRFGRFKVGAVAMAGLMDGINPCAFTTIVFLLSMLAYLGRTRRQLAVVGVGFTAAVFVTYLLLGLGLLGAIRTFSVSHGVSRGLSLAVGGMTWSLAGWSLLDFVRYRRSHDSGKMTLRLPGAVKARIHRVIRNGLNTRNLLVGSLATGFLVSILESLCTGQVYLPTIMLVAREPGLRSHAVGYLLLYNLMFILPLCAILAMAWWGIRSETLGGVFRRNLGWAKLAMAGLFALLGALVIAGIW